MLDNAFYRVWTGAGDSADVTNWGAVQALGRAEEIRIAGGPGGVYLLTATTDLGSGAQPRRRLALRRYDRAAGLLGAPKAIGDAPESLGVGGLSALTVAPAGDAAGGSIHTVIAQTEPAKGKRGCDRPCHVALQVIGSRDGASFTTQTTIPDPAFGKGVNNNRALAARPDGGGLVFTSNGITGLTAHPFGRLAAPAGRPDCRSELILGLTRIRVINGCITANGGRFRVTGSLRVNGIELIASGAGDTFTIDRNARTIISRGSVDVRVGSLTLEKGVQRWLLPPRAGDVLDAQTGKPLSLLPAGGKQRIAGLQTSGRVTPNIVKLGVADLPINVEYPHPVTATAGGVATARIELPTDDTRAQPIDFGKPGAVTLDTEDGLAMGISDLPNLKIAYSADPNKLTGTWGIAPPGAPFEVTGAFGLIDGRFDYANAKANFAVAPNPEGLPLFPAVFLRDIGLDVRAADAADCAKPTKVTLTANVGVAPTVAGLPLLRIEGSGGYEFPERRCNLPGVFFIGGNGYLVGLEVAKANVRARTDGMVTFGAAFALGDDSIGISVGVDGGVNLPDFFGRGSAKITVFGMKPASADVVISSLGFGSCVTVFPIGFPDIGDPARAGFQYDWGDEVPELFIEACDSEELIPDSLKGAKAAATGSTFTVKPGAAFARLRLTGSSGVPGATLVAPDGTRTPIAAGTTGIRAEGALTLLSDTANNALEVRIDKPAAGGWSVETDATVLAARPAAPASVSGTVSRKGKRDIRIAYKVRPIPGQKVMAYEDLGGGEELPIGEAKGSSGTLRIKLAGPRGRRTVKLVVLQNGAPRLTKTIGSYVNPGPLRPQRIRGLRVSRSGRTLTVRWRRDRAASSYALVAQLADGRRESIVVGRSKTSAKIRDVAPLDPGVVTITGVAANNALGPRARARVRAAAKPRCRAGSKVRPPACRR